MNDKNAERAEFEQWAATHTAYAWEPGEQFKRHPEFADGYADSSTDAAWVAWQARAGLEPAFKPFAWITLASMQNIVDGYISRKGTVPVHRKPSNTAKFPLYIAS